MLDHDFGHRDIRVVLARKVPELAIISGLDEEYLYSELEKAKAEKKLLFIDVTRAIRDNAEKEKRKRA